LGHAGEEAIRDWFENSAVGQDMQNEMTLPEQADFIKYDGNAQGFRILSRLEMPDHCGGMQLTCATLGAFTKYPGSSRSSWKKCGFFQQEAEYFAEVANSCGMLSDGQQSWCRHPLSFLLEAADDIAYLTVDFEDALRMNLIEYSELEDFFLTIIDSENSRKYVKSLSSPLRRAEFLRAQVIGVLVRAASEQFIAHHDELLDGSWRTPLTEAIPQKDILAQIRRRSVENIYNHRSVAEIVGAGFELVTGMLDVFMPCVNEIARENAGGKKASYRSKRIAAILPVLELPYPGTGSPAYVRLLRLLDYISGMSDSYAISLYQKLKGISL
jgi:dGTPase